MLFVPIGALLLGRSLVPALDGLFTFGTPVAPSAAVVAATEGEATGLRGRVVDGDGNPVAGVTVHVMTATPPFELLGDTKSGPSGAFVFSKTYTEPVKIVADRPLLGTATSPTVTGDAPGELLLVLSTADVIRGSVLDAEKHPVAGATVSATGIPWAVPSATTDETGAFELKSVPHDAPSVVAVASGFISAEASLAARVQSGEAAEVVVKLTLVASPPIEGEVADEAGEPIEARIVACEGQPAEAKTTSQADGTFQLPPKAVGCVATAQHEQFGTSDGVTVASGARLKLRLKAGGSIEGVVVDERGSSVSAFRVGVESFATARGKGVHNGGPVRVEDPSGAFRLEKLAPGTYVLSVSAAGKTPGRSDPIEVATGQAVRGVRIVLGAGGTVRGHVYDDRHAPIAGVDLSFDTVSSVFNNGGTRVTTDDRGAFRLEGAPVGPFTLHVRKEGYRDRMVAGLHVEAGGTLDTDVTLNQTDGGPAHELDGIGATLEPSTEGVRIRAVLPDSPAGKADLHGGDRIVRIDAESTDGMSLADVIQHLRGEAGTTVGVSVVRAGSGEAFEATVVRAHVAY